MNEIKLASYTLMTVMLLSMATFCMSINALNKTTTQSIKNDTTTLALRY